MQLLLHRLHSADDVALKSLLLLEDIALLPSQRCRRSRLEPLQNRPELLENRLQLRLLQLREPSLLRQDDDRQLLRRDDARAAGRAAAAACCSA